MKKPDVLASRDKQKNRCKSPVAQNLETSPEPPSLARGSSYRVREVALPPTTAIAAAQAIPCQAKEPAPAPPLHTNLCEAHSCNPANRAPTIKPWHGYSSFLADQAARFSSRAVTRPCRATTPWSKEARRFHRTKSGHRASDFDHCQTNFHFGPQSNRRPVHEVH